MIPLGVRGEILRLKGKSRKGKNRVKENGDDWVILEAVSSVSALKGQPGFLIAPVADLIEGYDRNKMRWMHQQNDPDFEF